MDFQYKNDIPNPCEDANPVSKLFFWWLMPFLRKGYRQDLQVDDLYSPLKEDVSQGLGDQLEETWEKLKIKCKEKNKKPKFFNALASVFVGKYLFYCASLFVSEILLRVAQVVCLKYMVASFSTTTIDDEDDNPENQALRRYLFSGGICVCTFVWALFQYNAMYGLQHCGMKCRIASSSLIYRKALCLSKSSDDQTTIGQLVNLLSNDVNRVDITCLYLPYLIISPLQSVVFIAILWLELGYASVAGVSFIVLSVPAQLYCAKLFAFYRREAAKRTDERGRLMNEIIVAMRVIKMYAWEKPFSEMVDRVRRFEVKILRKAAVLRSINDMSMFFSSSKLVVLLAFLLYIFTTPNSLTADKVFYTVAAYNQIRHGMFLLFPRTIALFAELKVSLRRIEDFLLLEEQNVSENMKIMPTDPIENHNDSSDCPNASILMKNACARWSGNKLALNHLTTNLQGDSLVMVVGTVGSGKTSLLHAIINELPISSGSCQITGSTSYATQEPWIFTGNLRQNVLFGLKYDAKRYEEVIGICALKDDLKQLPFGDNTIVGERGTSLSGGQKARVSLARALYREADIYLLDDPLSAVDARVSRHIFEKCVKKHLRGKLRILVTHQLQYLPQADHIIVLNDGKILAQGRYEELLESGIDFFSLIANDLDEDRKASLNSLTQPGSRRMSRQKSIELSPQDEEESEKPQAHAEKMVTGSVGLKLYWEYFKSGGSVFTVVMMATALILSQLLYSFADIWLSAWANAEEERTARNGTSGTAADPEYNYLGQDVYIYVYTGVTVSLFFLAQAQSFMFFRYCMRIGVKVHDRMFRSLIRAPTKFFDDNPSGRVMNRFTKDLGSMDDMLPTVLFDAIALFLLAFGTIMVVCISNYILIAPSAVLIVALFFIRRFYFATAGDVKRIEAVTRSPLFTHVASSIQGLTTIRALKAQPVLISQFDGHQDLHSSAWFIYISATRWFAVWLEMTSTGFLIAVCIILNVLTDNAMVGNVGLAISSILSLNGLFQFGIRQSAETANFMTSVERALEYAKLEPEAPLESAEDKKPPKNWPAEGSVSFQNVCLAYDEKDVLKDLTFQIKAKEKIGVVGRTGAGKSSIIAALFRMTECRSGQIFIDGICTNQIGLHDLRKSISIIPQDPVLFIGTVRYNLDPFSQFNDNDLWKVLEEVELKDAVESLDSKVTDGGGNFSVGQRQLVCLARAILRRNKIILMDEITANVDPRTDNLIQRTIRTKFADCTIITIAHRLHSVIDCDRILVLDNGYLMEFDHPHNLLQNPDGHLTTMVKHTGKATATTLRQIAEEAFLDERSGDGSDNTHGLKL